MSLLLNIPARIARAQAGRLFRLTPITVSSVPAPPATAPAQAPPPCSQPSLANWIAERLNSRQTPPNTIAEDTAPEPELHLPDETRTYIMDRVKHCPLCGNLATLFRSYSTGRPRYQVVCNNKTCSQSTPWHAVSRDAVRAWETYCVLVKSL